MHRDTERPPYVTEVMKSLFGRVHIYFQDGDFDWDEKTQGLILGSFYYGYTCTNLLGGLAAERWVV